MTELTLNERMKRSIEFNDKRLKGSKHTVMTVTRVVSKDWSRGLYWKSRWPAVIVS
jgi:hypothetical protein